MVQTLELAHGRLLRDDPGAPNVLVYLNPTEAERRHLSDAYEIDEHTLASALDPDELARLEFEPGHVAIILKRPRNYSSADEFVFRVASMGLFLFPDKLILVHSDDGPLFEGKPFLRVASLQELLLKLISSSISHFVGHLKVINAVSESLEDQINASMQNKYLLNLFSLEKSLVYFLNAINTNAKLIERLKNSASKVGFTPDAVEFIDDIIIENNQCYEQAKIYADILAGLMDARVSIVSNNLNWLMKTLTLVTIAIMLPTFVVSLFSMNVPFPGQNSPLMFFGVLGLVALSVVCVWLVFRWKGW